MGDGRNEFGSRAAPASSGAWGSQEGAAVAEAGQGESFLGSGRPGCRLGKFDPGTSANGRDSPRCGGRGGADPAALGPALRHGPSGAPAAAPEAGGGRS